MAVLEIEVAKKGSRNKEKEELLLRLGVHSSASNAMQEWLKSNREADKIGPVLEELRPAHYVAASEAEIDKACGSFFGYMKQIPKDIKIYPSFQEGVDLLDFLKSPKPSFYFTSQSTNRTGENGQIIEELLIYRRP